MYRRNAIRRLMESMVGGRTQVARMPAHKRSTVRAHAAELHDQGVFVASAAYAAASDTPEGFVYIVTNPAFPGYVKIGCALDACSRLADFQTACPFRAFKLEHAVYTSDRRRAEYTLHELFAHRRASGEWFCISVGEAEAALEDVREFDPSVFS